MKLNAHCLLRVVAVAIVFVSSFSLVNAQTNPVAASLPYSQNFTALAASSTVLPSEWASWNLSTIGPTTAFPTAAPPAGSDLTLTPSATASTSTLGLMNYNGKIGMLSGTGANSSLVLAISTTNVFNVSVVFDVMTIRNPFDATNTRIEQVDLQFRVGTVGVFSSVSGVAAGIYQNNNVNQTGAVTTPQNSLVKTFTLPAACNNKPVVQLRWVTRDVSGINNRPSFAIDNVSICSAISTPTVSISGPSGSCAGNNSFYNATITNGGTAPAYQWKKNGTNVGTNSSFLSIPGLIAGDQITCQLTSNATCVSNNVVTSNTITISSTLSPPIINLVSTSDVTCPNAKNGAINISVSGGTPPYTFAWDTVNRLNGSSFAVTIGPKTISDPLFGQGNPNVFYIDGSEAKELYLTRGITYSFNVLTPAHPFQISTDLTGGNANFIVSNGQTGAPSQNGTVNFTPNSSHPSLLYYPCQFHTFMGYRVNIISGQQTEDLSNLNPGIYNVVVADANGCTAVSQFQVNELPSPVQLTANVTNALCGTPSGSIDLTVSGGVAPYTFIWDTINIQTGNTFGVLTGPKTNANPYYSLGYPDCFYINGEEAKSLSLVRGVSYSFNVFTPGHPFHISTDSIGGSSVNIVSQGQSGSPNDNGLLSYVPSSSAPTNLFYDCANHAYMGGQVNLFDGQNSEDLTKVMPGIYSVVAIDAIGCIAQLSVEVSDLASSIVVTEISNIPSSCETESDGALEIDVTGGTPPYSIVWDIANYSNGGIFNVVSGIKSPENPTYGLGSPECFFTDGVESKVLTLTRGFNYLFNIFNPGHFWHISLDYIGGNFGKMVNDGQSGAPSDNGSVLFTPNSSHPDLLHYVCGVHEYMGADVNIVDGFPGNQLSNLAPGIYNVLVTDANGCTSLSSFEVLAGANPCVLNLNLKFYLQGLYMGLGMQSPRLFNNGLSTDPSAADSVLIELRDANDLSVKYSTSDIVHTDGMMYLPIPNNLFGSSYYIVVKHSNSIETWSKDPVQFITSPVSFDFTGQN